jgi:hypothetical protein
VTFEYRPRVPSRPPGSESPLRRLASRAGFVASALAVFTCGWLAMQTSDWRRIVLFSLLAVGAGALATAFSRGSR